jgi:hypothetical protein
VTPSEGKSWLYEGSARLPRTKCNKSPLMASFISRKKKERFENKFVLLKINLVSYTTFA